MSFDHRKASVTGSAPHLPFPLVPADGSLRYIPVLGELEKSLSISRFVDCPSTEQQAIAQVQLMNGTKKLPNYCKEKLGPLAFAFLRAYFSSYKRNYF